MFQNRDHRHRHYYACPLGMSGGASDSLRRAAHGDLRQWDTVGSRSWGGGASAVIDRLASWYLSTAFAGNHHELPWLSFPKKKTVNVCWPNPGKWSIQFIQRLIRHFIHPEAVGKMPTSFAYCLYWQSWMLGASWVPICLLGNVLSILPLQGL